MTLKNKIALVTGGSSGIGKALIFNLAKEGCNIIFTYNKKKAAADEIAKELKKLGVKVLQIKVDLSSENDINTLFEIIKNKFTRLDILVNNAGINRPRDLFDTKVWKEVFQINLFSAIYITGKAFGLMKDGGKILNVSSVVADGKACWTDLAPYGASKAALSHFTQTLAKTLAPKILVNAIEPGYVKTPLWINTSEEEFIESGKDQLIERMILPDEIAEIAVTIIKSDVITGSRIVVDGGISLKTI